MKLLKNLTRFTMDTMEEVAFIGSIFIVTYLFLFRPTAVKGASMESTLHNNDRLILSSLTYKFRGVERGDIVAFHSPVNPSIDLIKRVIALPGDRIMVKNSHVFLNGKQLEELYAVGRTLLWEEGYMKEGQEYTIEKGTFWAMGDNRERSSDSRMFGPIELDTIVGQAAFRFSPGDKIGPFSNPFPSQLRTSK